MAILYLQLTDVNLQLMILVMFLIQILVIADVDNKCESVLNVAVHLRIPRTPDD